ELQHQLADAEASVVVCLSALFSRLQAVRAELPRLRAVIVTNIKEYFPGRLRLLFTLSKERSDGHRVRVPSDGATYQWSSILKHAQPLAPDVVVRGSDLALLQYTGGTTGTAKAAMLTHRNLVANTLQVRAWYGCLAKPDGSDVVLG